MPKPRPIAKPDAVLAAAAKLLMGQPPEVDIRVALTELKGVMTAMAVTMEAHNIASVERDTRIEDQTIKTNGTVTEHTAQLLLLMADRTIWTWVQRVCILGTPIIVGAGWYFR